MSSIFTHCSVSDCRQKTCPCTCLELGEGVAVSQTKKNKKKLQKTHSIQNSRKSHIFGAIDTDAWIFLLNGFKCLVIWKEGRDGK